MQAEHVGEDANIKKALYLDRAVRKWEQFCSFVSFCGNAEMVGMVGDAFRGADNWSSDIFPITVPKMRAFA